MFYHAKIKLKPGRAKDGGKVAVETDLTRDALLEKVVKPFVRGEQFFCGGVIIKPSEVDEVRFNETQQSSQELLPLVRARRMASGVISAMPLNWALSAEGQDKTREFIEEAETDQSPKGLTSSEASVSFSDRVFIVHGRDNQAVDQTELLIRRFGLTPVILREAPNAGRTVIEKFEAHTNVGFAIVLLTPDDRGGLTGGDLLPRARQNVIWEWGYLVARLGRNRVVCLYKDGVEIPSDLHGLVTINVAEDVRSSVEEIRRELIAAGYKVS